jgi:predicted RNA-binding protein
MCLAKAYLKEHGVRDVLLEDVASVKVADRKIFLSTIFGEQKELEADIREIDFEKASITLEKRS